MLQEEDVHKLDDTFRKYLKLRNNSSLVVQGKLNVCMEVNGMMQVIIEVFYMLDLHNHILSIGQLQRRVLFFLSNMTSVGFIIQT